MENEEEVHEAFEAYLDDNGKGDIASDLADAYEAFGEVAEEVSFLPGDNDVDFDVDESGRLSKEELAEMVVIIWTIIDIARSHEDQQDYLQEVMNNEAELKEQVVELENMSRWEHFKASIFGG